MAQLWELAFRLKGEVRRGWIGLPGVERVESVADHSFGVALLSLLEATVRGYDVEKAVVLALVHDLEEAITGDLTPRDKRKLGSTEVVRRRRRARSIILKTLPMDKRKKFRRLWIDLDGDRTEEARLVKDLDKFEMALQAKEYERLGVSHDELAKFYNSARSRIVDRSLKRKVGLLDRRRT